MAGHKSGYSYYPIFLNIQGKRCVVVGGGEVALRKVKALLEFGAKVTVISPVLCPGLSSLVRDGAIKTIQRDYKTGDLKGAFLAIAATNEIATNETLSSDAKRQGVLVNVVDNPEKSDFIVPACFRRGDLTIAVSTAGKSPALARRIRSLIEANLGEEYIPLLNLVNEVRSELKEQGITVDGGAWEKALDVESLIGMIRLGQVSEAKAKLIKGLGVSLSKQKRLVAGE